MSEHACDGWDSCPNHPRATLTDFLLARIAEDEDAARAVPPLGHNYDMGGNRQDERWVFDRILPSSADGMGNFSEHRNSLATAAHFLRHDPARVLAECEAKRRIVEVHVAFEPYAGLGVKCETCADNPEADYDGTPMIPWPCGTILALARVYADHPDYREEWRP